MVQRGPSHLGVWPPKNSHVPDLRYAYDVIQDGRTIVAFVYNSINTVPWSDSPISPHPHGVTLISATGGDVYGYDYLGQRVKETLVAATNGFIAFAYVTSAPDDALWTNRFGLPYLQSATPDVEIIQGASAVNFQTLDPSTRDRRGTYALTGATEGEMVEFSYACDRTNLHGDVEDRIGSGERIDDVTMAGTVNDSGAIAITVTQVADSSKYITFLFPADAGGPVQVANEAGTVNYQLSPLWISKYGRNAIDVDKLVTGVTENGTNIIVDLTGAQPAPFMQIKSATGMLNSSRQVEVNVVVEGEGSYTVDFRDGTVMSSTMSDTFQHQYDEDAFGILKAILETLPGTQAEDAQDRLIRVTTDGGEMMYVDVTFKE